MTTTINASNSGGGGLVQTADASGVLALQTAGTTAVTIDASQNVGIGTSSPGVKLDVTGSIRASVNVTSAADFIGGGASGYAALYANGSGGLVICRGSSSTNQIELYTNGSERARIDSSGNLLFNSGYGSVATAYGCRAWVYYNGSQAILGSANVTSLTINGTGDVVVNLTTNMPDANYAVTAATNEESATPRIINATQNAINNFRLVTWNLSSAKVNNSYNYAAIFR